MTRPSVRAAVSFVLTAVVVYGALLAAAVGLAIANGEGLSCRDAECGAVSNWLNDAYPLSLIAAIAVSVMAGAVVASRQTRT